ncbi:anthocyanin 5-aromatic acyltransferase-like [Tasmannia lanceolata]|uniref:anthocyanin 5-aromatic acyltransferase-like n=1 Tax=Tasmannia lanceolata TaxID=3420 RepID=UPI004062A528
MATLCYPLNKAQQHRVKVLENCRVSPPRGSVAHNKLPITLFDVYFVPYLPLQLLLLYEFPHPKSHFTHSLLPNLKHSLSLTLQLFFPLAGNLIRSIETGEYSICYSDGDSISFSLAESDTDFHHLASNHAQDVTEFDPFLPQLPTSDTQNLPLLALQVTIFPNSGISIGATLNHVAVDGCSIAHFMKSWASICRSGGDASIITSLPIYQRTLVKNLEKVNSNVKCMFNKIIQVREMCLRTESLDGIKSQALDKVQATFVLHLPDIEKLKLWVSARCQANCSTYVIACAYIWVCLVKAKEEVSDKIVHFFFPINCRERLDLPIPAMYFGNCVAACCVKAKGSDLAGEDGIVVASELIRGSIKDFDRGILKSTENWLARHCIMPPPEGLYAVSWSPKFIVYSTDFGWGRPRKFEFLNFYKTDFIYLAECGDEEGGIEVGLVLSNSKMEAFASLFANGLKHLSLGSSPTPSISIPTDPVAAVLNESTR